MGKIIQQILYHNSHLILGAIARFQNPSLHGDS